MEVEDLQDGSESTFLVAKWFSIDKDEGSLIYLLPSASEKEMTTFNYLFVNHSRQQFADTHIWFSVIARPPYSQFTRCQRLSVAMSLLFSVMLANIMFYGAIPKGTPETENNIRGFTFTWAQVIVGVQSAFITIPINLLLVALFNSIKQESDLPEVCSEISPVEEGSVLDEHSKKKKKKKEEEAKKKKKKFVLPHWVLYPAWFLCVLVILGCAFMVVWYGMAFGNQKSLEWLGSVSVGLIQDVILMQPLKVLIMALIVASFIKKLEKQERSRLEEQIDDFKDEFKNTPPDNRTGEGIFDRSNTDNLLPPDSERLSNMRQLRYRQRQMKAIVKEILYYLVYAVTIILLGYSLRDYSSFYQTRNLENMFKLNSDFKKVHTKEQVWTFIEKTVLPNLYPSKWYDLNEKWKDEKAVYEYPGLLYLDDAVSKIVTGARLRQVRVQPDSCTKADEIKNFTKIDCADYFSLSEEDLTSYKETWKRPKNYHGDKMQAKTMPWRYQEGSEMDGLPVEGEISLYSGGGYAVEIFPKWNNQLILKNLKDKLWIDRYTRALFIEFAIVNIGTNYFDAVSIMFEFPPYGGVIKFDHVITFRVTNASNSYSFLILLAEIAFLLYTVLFVIRETRMVFKLTFRIYIKSFWNLVEMAIVLLCFVTIVLTIYKEHYRSQIVERLPDKEPNLYINFQFAAYLDLTLTYSFALICFFIVLKFIKLLRFNKRISMISRTLSRAWFALSIFGIQFLLILMAFTLSGTLSFGKDLYGYKDNWSTFASVIRLILGKFNYAEFEMGDQVIGPLWFNLFHIAVNFIAINMYISILDDSMNEELSELGERENDYEILEYMMHSFKDYVGLASISNDSKTCVPDGLTSKNSLQSMKSKRSLASLRSRKTVLVDVDETNDDLDYFRHLFEEKNNVLEGGHDNDLPPIRERIIKSNKLPPISPAIVSKDGEEQDSFYFSDERVHAISTKSLANFGKYEKPTPTVEEDLLASEQFMFTLAKIEIGQWK